MTTERMKLADQYEAGLRKMEAAGYAEFEKAIKDHRLVIAALRAPEADAGAVVWQWRSRFEGGEWDAWETGRCCEAPPGMEVEERASPTAAGIAAPISDGAIYATVSRDGQTDAERADLMRDIKTKIAAAPAEEPSHVMIIGWETIRRLQAGEAVWFDDIQAGAVAADDLYAAPPTEPSRELLEEALVEVGDCCKALGKTPLEPITDFIRRLAAPPAASADAVRELVGRLRDLPYRHRDAGPIAEEAANELERLAALTAPVAGADAGMRERAEQAVIAMTEKWGNPNGSDYAQGMQDMGARILAQIRALPTGK